MGNFNFNRKYVNYSQLEQINAIVKVLNKAHFVEAHITTLDIHFELDEQLQDFALVYDNFECQYYTQITDDLRLYLDN